MKTRTFFMILAGIILSMVLIKCYQYDEPDWYCATCHDNNARRMDQTFCGKEVHCKDFIEFVIQSTVAIDSVQWECTIQ